VDRLNVSIDSLDPQKFAAITRKGDLSRVLDGVEAARAAGFARIKINTVAVKGFNDGEVAALCDYAWSRDLVPRFIEQMPMADGQLFVPGALMSAAEIRAAVETAHPGCTLVPDAGGTAKGAGPARYWRLGGNESDEPASSRLVGIISAMTEHFCATCNRVRVSASGALHACLGYDDAVDLRTVLRKQGAAAVIAAIKGAVSVKRDGHDFKVLGTSGLIAIGGGPKKSMIQIGG
jgi:cyclic pyranopterin phosphate synthase